MLFKICKIVVLVFPNNNVLSNYTNSITVYYPTHKLLKNTIRLVWHLTQYLVPLAVGYHW